MPLVISPTDPLTLESLAQVSAETLVPCQQPTPRGLLQQADCYQQRFIKYPGIVVCHSYAEFIYYILLEMDPKVSAFVPQPFKLKVRGYRKPYIPDCYVVRCGQPQVIEIKAGGSLDKAFNHQVAMFLSYYDMPFSVVSNEAVLACEQEARHWLPIIQLLVCAQTMGVDTQAQEYRLMEKMLTTERRQVADLLNPGLREEQWLDEIAFNRLLYQHKLQVGLQASSLQWDSEVRLCA